MRTKSKSVKETIRVLERQIAALTAVAAKVAKVAATPTPPTLPAHPVFIGRFANRPYGRASRLTGWTRQGRDGVLYAGITPSGKTFWTRTVQKVS